MGCVRPILQGDSYFIGIRIKVNGEPINIDEVKKIEFTLGSLKKYYDEDVKYDGENFLFPLSQQETINLQGPQIFEVRVKFNDNFVVGKLYGEVNVMYGSSNEVI